MKKLFLTFAACVAAMSVVTSCDDDEKMAMELSGDWSGEFYSCYEYYYKQETEPRKEYASQTYMQFIPNHMFGSTRGTGYELDIYNDGPIEYMYYEFDWKIEDGVISLRYFDNPDLNIDIYDYRLDYHRFKGFFGKKKYSFELYSVDDYDWNPYRTGYHFREGQSPNNWGVEIRSNANSDLILLHCGREKKTK